MLFLHLQKLTLLVLLSVAFENVKGQKSEKPPEPLSERELAMEEKNHGCMKKSNLSFSARLKNYPFSKSAQVQLVSFKDNIDTLDLEVIRVSDSLPRQNDTICYSKLTEVRTLSLLSIDRLTNILYNYGYKGPTHLGYLANCYNPRNAILFLNTEQKVIAFIEICFECRQVEKSTNKILLGEMCDQKMDMLYKFFQDNGIKYGVTNVPFYQGYIPKD